MFYLTGRFGSFINVIKVWWYYRHLLKMNMWVLSPHLARLFVQGACQHETQIARDEQIIKRLCEGVVLMPGWEDSEDAQKHLEVAKSFNLDVYTVSWGGFNKVNLVRWLSRREEQAVIMLGLEDVERDVSV